MFILNKFKKQHVIKVPKNSKIIHCDEKNILTVLGPLQVKSLKLKVNILLVPLENLILVTDIPTADNSAVGTLELKKLQGTTVAKIRQLFIEVTYILYQKLHLIGVGYRVFSHEPFDNQIYLKLGYSHLIYSRVPAQLQTYCLKFTTLFIFGNSSFEELTQTAAQIRSYKCPEPYKGKGILYDQESITIKKGKKI